MAAPVKKNFSWFKFFNSCSIPEDMARSYAEIFVENHMKSDMLADLDKEILQDLGIVSMGHIIRILKRAKALVDYQEKQRAKARRAKEEKEAVVQTPKQGQQQEQPDTQPQQEEQQQSQQQQQQNHNHQQSQQQVNFPYGPPQQLAQQPSQQHEQQSQHQQPFVSPHQVAVAHIIGYDAHGYPVYAHQPPIQYQPQQVPQQEAQEQLHAQQYGNDTAEKTQDIPASRVKVTRTGVEGGGVVVAKRQHDDDAERTTRAKAENGDASRNAKQATKRQQKKQEDSGKKKSVFDRIRADDKRRVKKGRGSTGAKMDEVDSQRRQVVVHPKKRVAPPKKKAAPPKKTPPKTKSIFNRLSK